MTPLFALLLALQSFAAGETLDYDLVWLKIAGGSMRMTIAPQPDDTTRYRITSVAASSKSFARIYSVRDEIQSYVDRSDFSTVRYEKRLREGGKRKEDITTIANNVATRNRPGKTSQQVRVTRPVFDPLSLVYHIRGLDLTPGKVHRFNAFADGKTYVLEAVVKGRESLETPAGRFDTIAVQPQMLGGGIFGDDDSQLTIWYSADARRLPVRIRSEVKVGTITATLRSVTSGVTKLEP
jgi:hypothetical protein